jgi:hypothetical protein
MLMVTWRIKEKDVNAYMCPHTTMPIYMCVLILLYILCTCPPIYVSAYAYICAHTTTPMYVSSYYYISRWGGEDVEDVALRRPRVCARCRWCSRAAALAPANLCVLVAQAEEMPAKDSPGGGGG